MHCHVMKRREDGYVIKMALHEHKEAERRAQVTLALIITRHMEEKNTMPSQRSFKNRTVQEPCMMEKADFLPN